MCLMCVEIKKGMTIKEVGTALREYIIPDDHEQELGEILQKNFDIKDIRQMFIDLDDND